MAASTISIAMCSYNMAPFIGQQLDSIAAQTRLPTELVLCDDGSQDATVEVARSFASKAPFPVRIVQNETRLGCNKNFERAISLCAGDIIFLCDHDDVWRPRKIELLAGLLRDASVGAAFGNADVVTADLTPRGFTLWDTCNFNPKRRCRFAAGEQFSELIINNVMQGAAAAFKASYRPAIVPIPLEWQHDYWIALMISSRSQIRFTEECLIDYRQHGSNLIGAGVPFRPPPPLTPLRKLGHRVQNWVKKARSRERYYDDRMSNVERELKPLAVLRERLLRLDQNEVADALASFDEKWDWLNRQRVLIEHKKHRRSGPSKDMRAGMSDTRTVL